MKNDNEIADKLDLEISRMFNNCQKLQLNPSEYIFYKESATSNSYWVILIFFEEETKLNEALNDGTCYQIHEYILHNLYGIEDFKSMNFTIDFECGITPNSQEDFEKLFSKFTKKLMRTLDIKSAESQKVCNICNHDFEKHQLRGEINEELGHPTKGWMICPEENCKYFRTWSLQTEN